jgi:hypothetical protein
MFYCNRSRFTVIGSRFHASRSENNEEIKAINRERLPMEINVYPQRFHNQKFTNLFWHPSYDLLLLIPDPRSLIPGPCFMMEYAQAVMQGQVELFFAVQEVIREECYM